MRSRVARVKRQTDGRTDGQADGPSVRSRKIASPIFQTVRLSVCPPVRRGSMHHTHYLWFNTRQRQEIIDITDEVSAQVRASGVREGMVLVSAMHISASVFVNDHESGLWHDILK